MIRVQTISPSKIGFQQLVEYSLVKSIENKIILIDDLRKLNINKSMELGFVVLLFCTQGKIELDINDEHYYVGTNDILYCNHGTMLNHISFDLGSKGIVLCISWEYAKNLLMRGSCHLEGFLHTRQYPLLHLQPNELQLIEAYHHLLSVKTESYSYMNNVDVEWLFLGFFQDLNQILMRHAGQWNKFNHQNIYRRRDDIFKKFIVLLEDNFRQEHFLSFYADKLCITPKYLSTVVKQVSGQSVSKWIDFYLVEEIKILLCSNLTIGEIAYQLHFSNPSFFGKYVKTKTGVSPQNLRKNLRTKM